MASDQKLNVLIFLTNFPAYMYDYHKKHNKKKENKPVHSMAK